MAEECFASFDAHRNPVPALSSESGKETTDERRGAGIYGMISPDMDEFEGRGLIFGASSRQGSKTILEQSNIWNRYLQSFCI